MKIKHKEIAEVFGYTDGHISKIKRNKDPKKRARYLAYYAFVYNQKVNIEEIDMRDAMSSKTTKK